MQRIGGTAAAVDPPDVCVFVCVRGVIRVDVDIQNIDLDQCATGESWFADTHECNRTTMEVNKKKKGCLTSYWALLA